jgi:hypothetical protein
MREFIKTYEFTGKLIIEDIFEQENVRCIYKDDYYSNKLMKGHFEIDALSIDVLSNVTNKNFIFSDKSGRTLEGEITGTRYEFEYNDKKYILFSYIKEYTQQLLWNDNKPEKVKITYNIPYIDIFNRDIRSSHGFDESYIFRFTTPKKVLKLIDGAIIFDDWVNRLKYEKPDFIFNRQLFIIIEKNINDYDKKIDILNQTELTLEDMLVLLSFVLNHRFSFYFYKAEYFDNEGKLTETFERKEKNWVTGEEFLNERNLGDFEKYFTMDNLSFLINKFFDKKNEIEGIKKLLYMYLTIKEINIFEPQFLLGYFLLEGISKLIINPNSFNNCEKLIKDAASKYSIDINSYNLKISHKRLIKSDSKYGWEITEYRNNLTHFNEEEFNFSDMIDEFVKMKKLARKLILCYIEPSLSDWPEP